MAVELTDQDLEDVVNLSEFTGWSMRRALVQVAANKGYSDLEIDVDMDVWALSIRLNKILKARNWPPENS